MKKLISVLLAGLLLLALVPAAAFAENYGTDFSVLEGSGTEADPYLIGDLYDLRTLRHLINDAEGDSAAGANKNSCAGMFFRLTADLDLSEEGNFFIPMSYWGGSFSGVFDGDGHTISNLRIDHSAGATMGFFSSTSGAVIRNLTFRNGYIHGNGNIGLVVGNAVNTVVENVKLTGETTVLAGGSNVGGVTGTSNNGGAVKDCEIEGTLHVESLATSGYNVCVGGFVGWLSNATVENAVISGSVTTTTTRQGAGGVAGVAANSAVIRGVTVSGTVASSASTCTGGVVGQTENAVTISDVTLTETSVVNVSAPNDGYTSSGGAAVVGCSWGANLTVSSLDARGTVSVKGGGGNGNGFIVGYFNGGSGAFSQLHIGGSVQLTANYYNYGLTAGKLTGSMTLVNAIYDCTLSYTGGNNDGVAFGVIESGGAAQLVNLDLSGVTASRNGSAIGSNYYMTGNSASDVYTTVESEGLQVSAGEKTAIVKDPAAQSAVFDALQALGVTTVYAHLHDENGNETPAAAAAAGAQDLLRVVALQNGAFVCEDNRLTVVGTIAAQDLGYDMLKVSLTFLQDGETVRTISAEVRTAYRTLSGYASVDAATASAQGIETVQGSYLFGLTVTGIPAGTYEVQAIVTGSNESGAGVGSAAVSGSVTIG